MKKFIVKVCVFSALFCCLNFLYLVLCMKLDWNFSKRLDALNLEKPIYKNIILGNSLAMDGIDSRKLSSDPESTYNLAIGGSSLKTNYIQLEEYIDIALKKPERVLLAVGSYRNNFFEDRSIQTIVEFTMSDYHYKLMDLPMVKFKGIFIELLKKLISSEHRTAKIVQGQLRINRTVPDKTRLGAPTQNIPFLKYQNSDYIKQISELCQQNQIELILIEMPGFRNTRNNESIGPYEIHYNQSIKVKLYNFNGFDIDSILNPNKDWLGGSHLNKNGAKNFTKYINSIIFK